MVVRIWARCLLVCFLAALFNPISSVAQTIYWKMDHIYGTNGVEIAVATPTPSDTTAPTVPGSLNHTAVSDSSVTLSWTVSTDPGSVPSGVAGYRIYRFNVPVGIVTSSSTLTFTDSTLQSGTVYVYKVAAFDHAGNQSAFSGTDTFTTTGVPAAPGNLHANRASSGLAINLSWTDHSLSESGFKIERKAWSGGTYAQIDSVSANATSYADSAVVSGTIYYYRVRAYSGGGNSDYSNEANACMCASSSSALSATATSTSHVDLIWFPQTGAVNHYSVQRRSNVGSSFAEIGTTTSATYADTAVSSGTTYMYKVVALDGSSSVLSSTDVDIATTIVFTDDPLVSGSTVVKAIHITELRTAVNAARATAGLSSATWTDSSLSGVSIKTIHVTELRTKLNEALSALSVTVPTYTDSTLTTGVNVVRNVHIAELREALK